MGLKQRLLVATLSTVGVVGVALIQHSEGYLSNVYLDPVGIPTVCWGHTGPEVKLGQVWSKARCEETLRLDIIKHQTVLYGPKSCVGVSLQPGTNRMDAVTSLTFNLGTTKFCGSTMARKLRSNDYAGASREFPKWVYAKGKVLPGLVIRRKAEQDLFNSHKAWYPYVFKETITQ